MSALDLAPSPETTPERRAPRVWLWATLSIAAVIAVVLGVIALSWWRTTPPELWPTPTGAGSAPVIVGHTYYEDASLTVRDDSGDGAAPQTLRFERVAPRVTENSAHAVVAVVVCVRNAGVAIGLAEASQLELFCSSVSPFTGQQDIELGFTTTQVLLAVTPTTQGVVHIEGLDVTYAAGGRSTTMAAGTDLTLTATR